MVSQSKLSIQNFKYFSMALYNNINITICFVQGNRYVLDSLKTHKNVLIFNDVRVFIYFFFFYVRNNVFAL